MSSRSSRSGSVSSMTSDPGTADIVDDEKTLWNAHHFQKGVRDKVPELINVPPKTPTLVREVHLFPAASIFGSASTSKAPNQRKSQPTQKRSFPAPIPVCSALNLENPPAQPKSDVFSAKDCYWSKLGPQQTPIRFGYQVYLRPNILFDLQKRHGPSPGEGAEWQAYGWKMVQHMLGGNSTYGKAKEAAAAKGEELGVDGLLKAENLEAVTGHIEELFQFSEPMDIKAFKQKCNQTWDLHLGT